MFHKRWRRHNSEMKPQGGRRISPFRVTKRSTKLRRLSKTTRSRVHVQTVGLNAETKKVSAPSRRRRMSLDIPFYRTGTTVLKLVEGRIVEEVGLDDGVSALTQLGLLKKA